LAITSRALSHKQRLVATLPFGSVGYKALLDANRERLPAIETPSAALFSAALAGRGRSQTTKRRTASDERELRRPL
jgi:hypothetical protein